MTPAPLAGQVREYDWGSKDVIQKWSNYTYNNKKIAEVWFGAHPSAPSTVDGAPLDTLIRDNPHLVSREHRHTTMPFLVKLLAADSILSLQVHPDKKQAEEGFHRENQLGIPVDAPHRSYKDNNHKPEVMLALTRFTALVGFSDVGEIITRLRAVRSPVLDRYAQQLEEHGDIHAVFTSMRGASEEELQQVVEHVLRIETDEEYVLHNRLDAHIRVFQHAVQAHPGDSSALVIWLMNVLRLMPWEYLFIPAGVLHAYVSGFGVEVMASSDNVVRGGLTTKHVDTVELDRITLWEPTIPSTGRANHRCDTISVVEDFTITTIRDNNPISIPAAPSAAVILPVGDKLSYHNDKVVGSVQQGEALFVAAGDNVHLSNVTGVTVVVTTGTTLWKYGERPEAGADYLV